MYEERVGMQFICMLVHSLTHPVTAFNCTIILRRQLENVIQSSTRNGLFRRQLKRRAQQKNESRKLPRKKRASLQSGCIKNR